VLVGVAKQSVFKQASLYGQDKACFQSWKFCWKTKNNVKVCILEEDLGYQVGAAGSEHCSVTASGYDGDQAAGCVTD
jgi:hypothetical protein